MPRTQLRITLLLGAVLGAFVAAVEAQQPLAQPWQGAYAGGDSNGPHVIGHWRFEAGEVTKDSGPRGLAGKLEGAVAVENGKVGGAIESFPGWPIEDKHHAVVVGNHPSLSPAGAFTAEMWLQAKPELEKASLTYLLDKKYASHHDFQWLLGVPEKSGARRVIVNLGFGADSESFATEPITFTPGTWHHIAFSYDGAGTVRFYRDGSTIGSVSRPGRRGIAAGSHGLSIGDRLGSNYGGFPGFIDEVRLCNGALEFSPASIAMSAERLTWIRFEKSPTVSIAVRNLQAAPLTNAKLSLSGTAHSLDLIDVPNLGPGEIHVFKKSLDTSLRPDDYEFRARLSVPGDPPMQRDEILTLKLVARRLPHRMPVLMWGIGSPTEFARELPRLKELGFNHCLGFGADLDAIWKAGQPVAADSATAADGVLATRRMLDTALANDFGIAAQLYPGYFLKKKPELARVDRNGQPYARHDCNAALPGLAEFSENVGKSVGLTYGEHPAFVAALINSEVRDDSEVSFSEIDRAAYRQFAGRDIPDEVATKWGVSWKTIPDIPADRVIPDDHPLLQFYRWFWTVGDGWNRLHTALHRGLKSSGREDIWTWYDPAIRVPSIGGSGGDVDVLSQWTYTEPSPLRVGYFADEVFAMSRAAPSSRPPRVMKMTQLFWYRSTSAPKSTGSNHIANPFDDHDPDAAYISIAPMHLRGAFWSMLSRPVSGLMYHGWSSLVSTDGTHAYKFTQPDLQTEFRRLHRDVLEPLGPMLLQVPDRRGDVAYLNSFTSQMFARRGSYGYSHDEAYLTLLHAQLQPEVIFEETLLKRGLDGFKLLVLVDCDVLTKSVAARIHEFQKQGGIVIGDPNLAPAIKPDIVLPRFTRTKKTAEDKAVILANAATLRTALDARYQRFVECSNPEIVTRVRSSGPVAHADRVQANPKSTADSAESHASRVRHNDTTSDYIFVVNDHREFGTYVGQHGLVMENGLPSDGQVTIRRNAGHVYDLLSHRKVSSTIRDETLRWPVQLGPCDGGIFLVTPRPIERIDIAALESARCGERMDVQITIADSTGAPVPAVIPLRVEITDPAGRPAEGSGFHGAASGTLKLKLDIADNDTAGVWQIRVHELASGLITSRFVRVRHDGK